MINNLRVSKIEACHAPKGGGGDNYFKRAEVFAQLGYATALLKDSDINTAPHQQQAAYCRGQGVQIFEWGNNLSTEGALFMFCPLDLVPRILRLSVSFNGEEAVNQHILNFSEGRANYHMGTTQPTDEMRNLLADAAGYYKWFKTIARAEDLARYIIGPNLNRFAEPFRGVINGLYQWAVDHGDPR